MRRFLTALDSDAASNCHGVRMWVQNASLTHRQGALLRAGDAGARKPAEDATGITMPLTMIGQRH